MGWFNTFLSWFGRQEKVDLSIATPETLEVIPHSLYSDQQRIIPGISKSPDPNKMVGSRGLSYFNAWQGTREFIPPQYDHVEVEILYDIESYFARATRAKLALFLREGFDFIGTNDDTVEYIRVRIKQIERASGIPFQITLLNTCRDLLVHSNAYWLKVRNSQASGGKIRKSGGKSLKPIAGYFRIPPETMLPEIDSSGNITRWKQMIGGTEKIFSVDDIVHFYTNRKGGYPLGVPSIVPVIDDIRALRSLEHNIDILIHKHLFPIVLWKVGTEQRPAQTFSDGTTEIEVVQGAVANMPTEGSLVVSERYNVSAIGAENKALRVESYLQHFRERLLAGLDVSSIDVGLGNCYVNDTETLTENGWKKHDEIDHKVECIATYNPKNEQIEFHKPNWKYEGYYKGDIICFSGRDIDIRVTPDHDMWVLPRGAGQKGWRKVKAKDLYAGLFSEFYILETATFNSSSNNSDTDFFIPAYPHKKGTASKPISCSLDDFASFLGWFVSEGNLNINQSKKGFYRTIISQSDIKDLNSICKLLNQMNISFNVQTFPARAKVGAKTTKPEGRITIYGKTLFKFLEEHIPHGAKNKRLPKFCFFWPIQARANLLDSLIRGDGTYSNKQEFQAVYNTSSKGLADDVQRLALSLGHAAKINSHINNSGFSNGSRLFRVFISKPPGRTVCRVINSSKITKEAYEGIIYCYNVDNHLFVTRRNGKASIQGNTASRSTASTLSRSLVDTVKTQQITIEHLVTSIIEELLLESTFNPETILMPENTVRLKFAEIDKEAKQSEANHLVDLFHKNAITFSEMRLGIGKEVLTPEEEKELWWNKFGQEEALIGSVDESSGKGVQQPASANGAVSNKNQPVNQNGTRGSAKLNRDKHLRDSYSYSKRQQVNPILAWHQAIGIELQARYAKGELKLTLAESDIKTSYNVALSEFLPMVRSTIRRNYPDPEKVHGLIKYMEDRAQRYIRRLRDEVIRRLKDNEEPNIIFAALAYRAVLIFDTELSYAKNVSLYRWFKRNKVDMKIIAQGDPCEICKPKLTTIRWNDKLGEANIPPFHCLCECRIVEAEG